MIVMMADVSVRSKRGVKGGKRTGQQEEGWMGPMAGSAAAHLAALARRLLLIRC